MVAELLLDYKHHYALLRLPAGIRFFFLKVC